MANGHRWDMHPYRLDKTRKDDGMRRPESREACGTDRKDIYSSRLVSPVGSLWRRNGGEAMGHRGSKHRKNLKFFLSTTLPSEHMNHVEEPHSVRTLRMSWTLKGGASVVVLAPNNGGLGVALSATWWATSAFVHADISFRS